MRFQGFLPTAILAISLCSDNVGASKHGRSNQPMHEPSTPGKSASRSSDEPQLRPHENFRFLNDKTRPYLVESLPDVPFDVGELYSGSVPIDNGNSSRTLFFVFQPTVGEPVDEITIEVNGGPGASSLEGFFQETGRFVWQPGTYAPVINPYSWVNLTNMLWVDQPVGTGFSTGTPTATTQEETSRDFIKFFKNFQDIFGIKKFKIYVTGQSYAGRYVPYIAATMLDQNDKDYYDVHGALAYDPVIGQFDYVGQQASAVPTVQQNANLFNFNASFMDKLERLHESCGYQEFMAEFLTFPPPRVQPPKSFDPTHDADCNIFEMITNAAYLVNPCYNMYAINQMCPLLWDVLGGPTKLDYLPAGARVYFDRDDVKEAMHAPNMTWSMSSLQPVFVGGDAGVGRLGDLSANPIERVLPQVIEATNRVLISHGDYDFILQTKGVLLSIQNMTWNGQLGFQSQPSTPVEIGLSDLQYAEVFEQNDLFTWRGGQGVMGIQHYERGLMWAETFQSGHMQPQYQPRVAYRHIQWLLGRIEEL
ncbi:Alpha/Beta hydrolase protein [Aspergillus bertholletiae]|uniref:Alpha/Beta hydrolase protein n=1 Tax=Aspergillus bertholletiae TaxID=1226010 RepID=A0A5N7AW46_9EURO|nr:Alpha/Beta hydrolase protein [Aspergillus bertholletiae]